MVALDNANRVRSFRAQLKRDVQARRSSAALVLLEPPADVETMRVFDLLLSIPKLGRTKVNKILVQNRISPSKTVGGLTARQRHELVVALGSYARGS